ncbi:Uncharacterised protein [Chryseobacterium nakagawai]|uniref:Uncharacterized protein n=1 Tax=Chryseobacterium nakagawai TaxID=1241982 RepID=A0AAD0YQ78_CHRNA|nr:DUF6712 family protein [Chryseobacterium nakagawai]AZA93042.1 hypothetical protein EG343_21780 [Chryseobacterium nakagawai]VEH19675.1 Uncharacterised protein [Chryseobacterium nakagawai]
MIKANILFDKTGSGSSEILEVLGINDADIDINHIWQQLRASTKKIIKIIGSTNYDIAVQLYNNGDLEDEYLSIIRYAIALDAFRNYAPLTDLAFTTQGRSFRNDEHNRVPWEWQIDKSDAAMEKSYYAIVNEIIQYIVEDEELEQSDYMLQFSGLFVPDIFEFQKYVHINDSYLLYFMLAPSMMLFEHKEILTRVGSKLEELKKNQDSYIFRLIQNSSVLFAMKDGLKKFSIQLFPQGTMKAGKSDKRSATGYDIESTVNYYDSELKSLLLLIENEIKKSKGIVVERRKINFDSTDGFVTM